MTSKIYLYFPFQNHLWKLLVICKYNGCRVSPMLLYLISFHFNICLQNKGSCTNFIADEIIDHQLRQLLGPGICDISLTLLLSLSVLFRVLASDTDGVIHIWDRRTSTLPYLELTANFRGSLNSIQLNVEDQVIIQNLSVLQYLYNFWEFEMLLLQKICRPAYFLCWYERRIEFNSKFSWLILFSLVLTLFVCNWIINRIDHA